MFCAAPETNQNQCCSHILSTVNIHTYIGNAIDVAVIYWVSLYHSVWLVNEMIFLQVHQNCDFFFQLNEIGILISFFFFYLNAYKLKIHSPKGPDTGERGERMSEFVCYVRNKKCFYFNNELSIAIRHITKSDWLRPLITDLNVNMSAYLLLCACLSIMAYFQSSNSSECYLLWLFIVCAHARTHRAIV